MWKVTFLCRKECTLYIIVTAGTELSKVSKNIVVANAQVDLFRQNSHLISQFTAEIDLCGQLMIIK